MIQFELRAARAESLRKEIEWLLTDARAVERNVVIAVGATWARLIVNRDKICHAKWAWCIPVLFVGLGVLRSSAILKQFGVFHKYLEELEELFSGNGCAGGWEHFSWREIEWVSRSAIYFWAVLFVATIGVGIREWIVSN